MPEKFNSPSLRFLFLLTIGTVSLFAAATAAQAQFAPGEIRQVERENSSRENSIESRTHKRNRDPNEVMAEVNDDLRQLNQLNDVLAMHTATAGPLDYDSLLSNATEIKKRSLRLRTDLALPKGDSKEKLPDFKDAEQGELQPALSTLHTLLESLLHNPIFSDAGEVDMQLAAKARRDLDTIVVLSEKVRKNAEKRSKASAKSQ
ncbi:MAG TPA: hypothetical protein DC047_03820 [Blastocatellia bacterium]|nr:hypothetical protein [Blastocatellia bacterium]